MRRALGSDPADMPIHATQLTRPAQALSRATDDHAQALSEVQSSVTPEPASPRDRVTLSPEARAAEGAAPDTLAGVESATSTEQAIADAAMSDAALQAATEAVRAEDERRSALIFVLAHHGGPLR